MYDSTIAAYLSFIDSYSDSSANELHDTLEELCSLSGVLDFPMYEYGTPRPSVQRVDLSSESTILKGLMAGSSTKRQILKIEIEVPVPEIAVVEKRDGERRQVSGSEARAIHEALSSHVFAKRICDLVVVGNIARPAVFDIDDGLIVQKGRRDWGLPQCMDVGVLRGMKSLVDSIKWPPLQCLELVAAWQWAVEQQGFLEGFGGNSVDRALNAFNHVLQMDIEYTPMQLLWALIGVEALYAEGNTGIMRQVREKSQAFLGPQDVFKKKIGNMYDFRSRFVHGELAFSGPCPVFDASDRVSRFHKGLSDSTALAVAVLLASLQELAHRKWHSLDFYYGVAS